MLFQTVVRLVDSHPCFASFVFVRKFICAYYSTHTCKHDSHYWTGLPAPHFSYVKNVSVGLPLFLFNYSDRKLHGMFEAASPGQLNIDPCGWTSDGSNTPYAAQVLNAIITIMSSSWVVMSLFDFSVYNIKVNIGVHIFCAVYDFRSRLQSGCIASHCWRISSNL